MPSRTPDALEGLARAVERVLADQRLLQLARQHPAIAGQVGQRLLAFALKASQKAAAQSPQARDLEQVAHELGQLAPEEFWQTLPDWLPRLPQLPEASRAFALDQRQAWLEAAKDGQELDERAEALQARLAEQARLLALREQAAWELDAIERQRREMAAELYRQMDDFLRLQALFQPMADFLGRFWDLVAGNWHKAGFDMLHRFGEMLRRDDSIRQLAELLGRFREAEVQWVSQRMETLQRERVERFDPARKSEYVGLKVSDDLAAALPSELALLADPDTSLLFMKNFAEKKLLTWEFQARSEFWQERRSLGDHRVPREKDRGPIILCVDTSASMHGAPELMAKLLALALLRLALQENRPCWLVLFSQQARALELSHGLEGLPALADFLAMSFHGGTDAVPALRHALALILEQGHERADLLLVSDFVMRGLDAATTLGIERARGLGAQFHSLTLGASGNPSALESFDHNWSFDPRNPKSLLELVERLKGLSANSVPR